MNLLQVYLCSPSWTLLPPLSPYPPSGSSQCTSPKHPVSCIEPGLVTRFIHNIIHVSMPFSQISPPSPSPTESIRLIYTSVSLLLSCTQGYCYHLSKFHIYALVYCIVQSEVSQKEKHQYSILTHIYGKRFNTKSTDFHSLKKHYFVWNSKDLWALEKLIIVSRGREAGLTFMERSL